MSVLTKIEVQTFVCQCVCVYHILSQIERAWGDAGTGCVQVLSFRKKGVRHWKQIAQECVDSVILCRGILHELRNNDILRYRKFDSHDKSNDVT